MPAWISQSHVTRHTSYRSPTSSYRLLPTAYCLNAKEPGKNYLDRCVSPVSNSLSRNRLFENRGVAGVQKAGFLTAPADLVQP